MSRLLKILFFWIIKQTKCFEVLYSKNIKQLLDKFEHDIVNSQGQGLCYLPKPKAEVDIINRGLDNSRFYAKTECNNCFIMYSKKNNAIDN